MHIEFLFLNDLPSAHANTYSSIIHEQMVVYLMYLQHELCELTTSKYNINSHKNSCSCNAGKYLKSLFFNFKFILFGTSVHTQCAHPVRNRGERPVRNPPDHWNFNFIRDCLFPLETGYDTVKLKYFLFFKLFSLSLYENEAPFVFAKSLKCRF